MSFSFFCFGVVNFVFVYFIVILMVIVGIMVYCMMLKDQYLDVVMVVVVVMIVFFGVLLKEVEQFVIILFEEEFVQFDDIDMMELIFLEGILVVFFQFDMDVDENFEKVIEVQNKINQVQCFFEDVEFLKV